MLRSDVPALFYVAALFYISWPLTTLVVGLGLAIGGTLAFVYRRLGHASTRVTDLNHQLSAAPEQSFVGKSRYVSVAPSN